MEAGEVQASTPAEESVPIFGARKRARELMVEVGHLREQLERLGALSIAELEQMRDGLRQEVEEQRTQLTTEREEAAAEIARQAHEAQEVLQGELASLNKEKSELDGRLSELREQVVVTEETALLQEVGVYEYRHPLSDAVAYQQALKALQTEAKAMTRKDGGAVYGATNWQVNGSLPQGRKMVRDFSKLMLRPTTRRPTTSSAGSSPTNSPRRSRGWTESSRRLLGWARRWTSISPPRTTGFASRSWS